MNYDDAARIRENVLLKSFREQTKTQFASALIRAVKSAALANIYRDGFVEWFMVECELDSWNDRINNPDLF